MKQTILIILTLTLNIAIASVQPEEFRFDELPPGEYRVDAVPDSGGRLISNSIIDIVPNFDDQSIWLGTGRGLAQHFFDGSGWAIMRSDNIIGKGGVSAIALNDTMIWAATAYTERTSAGFLPAGGGVGFSLDDGESWIWRDQPVDPREIEDYHPTTTNIQNVTYDIALSQTAIWIVSWGGGLRRLKYDSLDVGKFENDSMKFFSFPWEIVTVDRQPFWALDNLKHRTFSTIYTNNTLFVGTAGGISFTDDEGFNWEHESFVLGTESISGNFVTAMAAQKPPIDGDLWNIWAATWKANGAFEYNGVCVSEDNGLSWQIALSDSTELPSGDYIIDEYGPLHVHNFGFSGETVYAAADKALWVGKKYNNEWEWAPFPVITDATIGEDFEEVDFFSVAQPESSDSLWIGTDDGLAVYWYDQDSDESNWRIHRAHQPAGIDRQPDTYAYPSPFSPRRGQSTRFQFRLREATDAKVTILNFAMEKVYESPYYNSLGPEAGNIGGYANLKWDGQDNGGSIVANGVYFYCINARNSTWWGKIMVLD